MRPATRFDFGPWTPDQSDHNQSGLIECKNVLPVSGKYQPYRPLLTSGVAVSQTPLAALRASGNGGSNVYVGASSGGTTKLYIGSGVGAASWTDKTGTALTGAISTISMTQYNETVISTDYSDPPQYHTLGGGGNFAKLTGADGDAPNAAVVGVIGQFVMLGNLQGIAPYAVQWSGINAPFNWPTPNSAAAIAEQSGRQYCQPNYNEVLGISQGDQWGLILMDGGIVRATYAGGNVVFQFDTVKRAPGPISQDAWIKVGPLVYYASSTGFYVCDGTQAVTIGHGAVNDYFASNCAFNFRNSISCGVNYSLKLIYWTFANNAGSGTPNEMLVYNYEDKSWTHVFDTVQRFVAGEEALFFSYGVEAFSQADKKCGVFAGFPGTATFVTAEKEFNPGGRTIVNGFKPIITGSNSMTVKIGSRNDLNASASFTGAVTPTASTGFADFLIDAKYHRAQIDVSGAFTEAIGGEFDANPTSEC